MKASNGLKICSHCKVNKPVSEYHKNSKQSDGLHNWCKSCLIMWRNERKEQKQEYDKLHTNPEMNRKKARDWYYANHEYGLQYRRNYHQKNKQRDSDRMKRWRTEHPEKVREIHGRQKAKRREMGFIKLWQNPFPEEVQIDWHHINGILVVPMPKKIHNKCSHLNPEEHRERCNKWLSYLYGIDINKLLN